MMRSVAITGVSGALGRRIVTVLAGRADWRVVGIDTAPFPEGVAKPRHFTVHRADLRSADCRRLLEGVDAVVHLAAGDPESATPTSEVEILQRLLGAVAHHRIGQFVMMSSAVVYGAYPENAIPLLEGMGFNPNVGFGYAEAKVRAELELESWHRDNPSVSVAVMRPAVTLGHPEARAWLATAVQPSLADRIGHGLPALQFVHVDDLANAVVTALDQRLDGPFNVAADDWIPAEQSHEQLGPNLRLPLPDWLLDVVVWFTDRRPGRRRPEGALPYSRHPWVIAVDRLKAAGWSPQSTSAEAFVASRRQSAFSRYYAKRRQEVTLAIFVVVLLAGLGVFALLLRRFRRNR